MILPKNLDHPFVAEIEDSEYLRTVEIHPVLGSVLELDVGEAAVQKNTYSEGGIDHVRSIDVCLGSKIFAFRFEGFVSYSVTDEMFIRTSTDEIFIGGRLRSYSESYFLEYVLRATWASPELPGELLHYQLNTLDHTIDVITAKPPILSRRFLS